MSDVTLIKTELKELATEDGEGDGMILGADEESLKGASYDFRAGTPVTVVDPERDEDDPIKRHLDEDDEIKIKAGGAATFRSQEKLDLPADVKGRLSPRSKWSSKKLFYPGGIVDPGYSGYLWFTFFNLGTQDYPISYGDELVTGEFVRIEETEPFPDPPAGDYYETLRENMEPRVPTVEGYSFDWSDINRRINDLEEKVSKGESKIKDLETKTDRIDDIMRYILFAVVAGLFVGMGIIFARYLLRVIGLV